MMARAVPGLPLLVPLLVLVATMPTSEADVNLKWPFYGCYEFDFTETIFFNYPPENTAPPGCKNCKEQKVITPKELPHDLLKGSINNLTNNTPQECMKICNSTGYSFAGVQDGSKCVCASEHPHSKSAYEDCNMPCSGDGSQICGGHWKMNLYGDDESTSPFKPPGTNGTSRVQYLGCYSNTLDRLLSGTYDNSKTNSPIQCVDSCIESGYAYAGLQYKTQCICANEEPQGAKQNESSCDYACPGDANAKCGGHWMMNVYQIAPAVNCTWSDWTWDSCSKSCGGGNQNGTRVVAQPAEHGGSECEGQSTSTQSCNLDACPKKSGEGQFIMWIKTGQNKPSFISVEPSVNPLPECLNKGSSASMINGTIGFSEPAYLTLPDGSPVICEGRNDRYVSQNPDFNSPYCFKYNMAEDVWSYHSKTLLSRGQAFHDRDPRVGVVIAGGNNKDGMLKTVEITRDFGATFEELAPLPEPSYVATIFILNETAILYKPIASDQLYLLDLETNAWTEGPKLKVARHGGANGIVTRPSGEREIIFASGNADPALVKPHDLAGCTARPKITRTVEIYNIANNTVRDGPDTDISSYAGMTIPYKDTFLLMSSRIGTESCNAGPASTNIYRYNMEDGQFELMEGQSPFSAYFEGPPLWVDDLCG